MTSYRTAALIAAAVPATAFAANTVPLRVVTYNVAADVNGATTVNDTALKTVLGGLGNFNPDGLVRPIDLLALQETTSNAATVAPIAADLNAVFNTSSYTVPALQPGESGNNPTTGNGPSSIVYNAATLRLASAVTIGPASGSSNGVYRQVARYQFQPAASLGGTAAGAFYVYVEHAKSGSTAANQTARGQEAALVRADAAALPANSRVVYAGDLNVGASTEQSLTTLYAAGTAQAFDPLNQPGNYALNPAFQGILTESATDLRYRDDFQLVTANVKSDPTGLQYAAGSYTAFGNNGTTAVYGTVNAAGNTALPGLSNRAAVLSALTTVTDHLPVVADYLDVVGPTAATWASAAGGNWSTLTNWSTAVVPDGAGSAVTFGPTIAAAATVTPDTPRTVGRVTFNSAPAYTLAGTALTIDDAGDLAGVLPTIAVTAGSHFITAPLTLTNGVTITTAAGASLTLGNSVGGTGPVTVAGTVTFAANPTPATRLARAVPGLAIVSGSLTVAGTGSVLTTPTLAVTGGTLNLTGNDLVVSGGTVAAVSALVAAGRVTATAAPLRALGVVANDDGTGQPLYGAGTTLGLFDGTSPAVDAVLVRYTLVGDANLDGVVNGADYVRLDAGYAQHLTGWYNGDFNDDGVVDGSDYTLIDNAFDLQPLAATPTAEVAAVPEPTALAAVGVAIGLVRRRRRSS